MVYCGRPSTSCSNCRAKKRRCDKAVPECGQCWRTGQKCPGYRDPLSLIFRDESTQVINRARSKVSKRTSTAIPTDRPQAQNQQQNTSAPDYHVSRSSDVVDETMLDMSDFDVGAGMFAGGSFMPESMSFHDPFNPDETGLFSLHQDASPSAMPVSSDDPGSAASVPASASGRRSRVGASSVGGDDVALDQSPDDGSNRGNRQRLGHNNFTSSQPEVIARPFSLPLVITGLNFFLSRYVVRQSGPSSGFFDYAPAMLAQDDGGNDMLEGAILAVGFSGLARTTSQADLLTRSMMMYTRTMERVNLALADPQAARRDSTIVSVLLLALYEFSRASIDGWKHHIEGATSLLNLRGRSQFSTSTGQQIFKDVFSQLLTNCLRAGSPMPSSLRMLRIEAGNAISVSDPYWVACSGVVELLDLYQHISPGGYSFFPNCSGTSSSAPAAPSDSSNSPSTASGSSPASTSTLSGPLQGANISIEHLERCLSQVLEIDYRLESAFSKCPSEWQFTDKSNSSSNSYDRTRIRRDVNHIYHDVWIASVWNGMRICRILANHAISHLLLRGANTDSNWFFANNHADRLHQATQTIVRLRDEMLASVPQLMGYATSPAQEQQQQQQQHERSQNSAGSAAGGYFACWVLLTVGCMHNLSHETRAWTAAQLRRISCQAGLAQADDFANLVQSSNLRPPLSG
ncbi:transcriptional regulator family: Fungal Specific TF [Penicillium psychrosexuale]|uniref:transcriptional regulator family: Fungal Specific TF n=1 Tax=Penicillium psychrosexuale TaxID=1002107 RepID=UPI002545207B|nr:transcriptional regulator family: Fungal Specific TF [Penicillium psychrosexuale]KAJ5796541.1 transcriptional regulator family: Fungal Specific TF [Penicillium psychrosexuale]